MVAAEMTIHVPRFVFVSRDVSDQARCDVLHCNVGAVLVVASAHLDDHHVTFLCRDHGRTFLANLADAMVPA